MFRVGFTFYIIYIATFQGSILYLFFETIHWGNAFQVIWHKLWVQIKYCVSATVECKWNSLSLNVHEIPLNILNKIAFLTSQFWVSNGLTLHWNASRFWYGKKVIMLLSCCGYWHWCCKWKPSLKENIRSK